MRDQFQVDGNCPLCGSQNVKAVRTREKTYFRCHDCRDVWRESQAGFRGVSEHRRSTDHPQQTNNVA